MTPKPTVSQLERFANEIGWIVANATENPFMPLLPELNRALWRLNGDDDDRLETALSLARRQLSTTLRSLDHLRKTEQAIRHEIVRLEAELKAAQPTT